MSRSDDPGHYFQTSDSLASIERKAAKAKNEHGNPIKLPSKILAVHADPTDDGAVYVAEAAAAVKRLKLESGTVTRLRTQADAPLTSIALYRNETLYAGCWDKHIYSTPLKPTGNANRARLQGHTDFVKCILATSLSGKPILLSGSADATIIVWDVTTGKQLHKLKGHTKALQDLAIDPLSLPEGASEPQDSFVLFTSSSDREIRRWHISLNSAHELPESIDHPVLAHETSVYKLRFDSDGDLWTASADKTAKHLVRSRDWEADTILQHPDFVRDVVINEQLSLVTTACRDEEVRVWDANSGDLVCTYSGHFEEVTGLALVEGGKKVVSVSIDGTVRQWSLEKHGMEKYLKQIEQERAGTDAEQDPAQKSEGMLTAEEEAELAELMDDEE